MDLKLAIARGADLDRMVLELHGLVRGFDESDVAFRGRVALFEYRAKQAALQHAEGCSHTGGSGWCWDCCNTAAPGLTGVPIVPGPGPSPFPDWATELGAPPEPKADFMSDWLKFQAQEAAERAADAAALKYPGAWPPPLLGFPRS